MSDDKHDDVTASSTQQSPSSRSRALARAVTETEAHVAAFGWDQPVRVLAQVRTTAAIRHLLAQLAWPDSVHGAAISVERLVLPPAAQEEADTITDAAERLAFLQERPDREDIRMVVGVLRSGESWCALRSRTHDDDASVYQGEQLVPGLVEAMAATFL